MVKPATVLYGSNLPKEFFERSKTDLPVIDLFIVAGTSLTVFPAAGIVSDAPKFRLVCNNEKVG